MKIRVGPSAVLLGLFAAGCDRAPADPSPAPAAAMTSAPDDRIDCRIGQSRAFERFCRLERGEGDQAGTLVLRKPDGGFRRLRTADDGRGVVAADGAEPAVVTIIADDRIQVDIGGDSFRLPARVRPR